MSKIGKLPIECGDKVTVTIDGQIVTVKGPRGTLAEKFPSCVLITRVDNTICVQPANRERFALKMWGTARAVIANMVKGVQAPFVKDLAIEGVGVKAAVKGKVLELILGYSHPIKYEIPDGIAIQVQDNTKIHVEGIDCRQVGQTAAAIKRYYPVEPYKGKGVRIIGEYVHRKEGKKKE